MLAPKDKVLVAVSGGPDSVAMLYLLRDIAEELNLKLRIIHLNHLLRPKEAEEEMEFVINLAKKLKIPVTTAKIDAKKIIKKEKLSLEEGARNLRYDFFLKTAQKTGAEKIAVAHTQDDQAETVLMRLIRGSGLLGLSAISPLRRIEDKLIIRPMINISRREIVEFLKKNKIKYRLDSSNKKTVFLRNKIRYGLLPYLKNNYKADIAKILSRAAESISLDYQFLNQNAQKIFNKIAKFKKGKVIIPWSNFQKYHLSLQKQIFSCAIKKVKGNLNRIEEKHYSLLLELGKNRKLKAVELPSQILVKSEKGRIIFLKKSETKSRKPLFKIKVKIPGQTRLPQHGLTINAKLLKKIQLSKIKHKKSPMVEYFDYAKLKKPLFIIFRKAGLKFQPLGMKEIMSLKEFFINEKIPREKREAIPLLSDGKDIFWVTGYRICEKAKITPYTKYILKLTLIRPFLQKYRKVYPVGKK